MVYTGEVVCVVEKTLERLGQNQAFDRSLLEGLRALYEKGELDNEESIRAVLLRLVTEQETE